MRRIFSAIGEGMELYVPWGDKCCGSPSRSCNTISVYEIFCRSSLFRVSLGRCLVSVGLTRYVDTPVYYGTPRCREILHTRDYDLCDVPSIKSEYTMTDFDKNVLFQELQAGGLHGSEGLRPSGGG